MLTQGFAIPMLIATVGVAVAFVLALLFSLETRGKELAPQLTLWSSRRDRCGRRDRLQDGRGSASKSDRPAHDRDVHLSRKCSATC